MLINLLDRPNSTKPAIRSFGIFTVTVSLWFLSDSTSLGQEIQSEQKVIREPVHRVAKAPAIAAVAKTETKPADSGRVEPVAENVKSPTAAGNTILPSTRKIVSSPESPAEAAVAEPTPNAVPAKSASTVLPARAPHPLDEAIETAQRGLENIQKNIHDYSAIMVKRERVNGKLLKPEYMQLKVRSEGTTETGQHIPFSVYMKFIKPQACAGREVIWVKGRNENKICVHEGSGLMSLKRLHLDPNGWIAMQGNRYPISEAGVENLVAKLVEKAERDRDAGNCEVKYRDGVKMNGRACRVIEVKHPEKRAPYDFHIAKVYIDNELKLPVRYQAFLWPEPGSTKPVLLEEYTYLKVKVNQGFTDKDFDPDNKAYNYPRR